MNKKGNTIADGILFVVIIFVIALVFVAGKYVSSSLNTLVQGDSDIASEGKTVSSNLDTRYATTFDSAFVVIFFLLWIAIIVASFAIDTHPWFFAIMALAMIFLLMIVPNLANTYDEFTTDAEFSAAASSFTLSKFIMNHYLEVFMVVAFTAIIALYMKGRA